MKHFLLKILSIIFIFVIIILGIELLISYRLKQKHQYYVQGDWHLLGNHNSNILFLGNSRTFVHIDPILLTKKLKSKCEIIAQDGQSIDVIWLKFTEYLKYNNAPKELYIQVDPFILKFRNDLYGIQNLRPYFFMDRINLSNLSEKTGYSSYYRYLPLAAMDFEYIWKMITDKRLKNYSFRKNRGSVISRSNWKGDWDNCPDVVFKPGSSLHFLDSFFSYSKTNNVKLYFIFPPMSAPLYKKIKQVENIESVIVKKIAENNYPAVYRNYNNDAIYNDSNLFYNHMHMNIRGVNIFMQQLLDDSSIFLSFRQK